MPPMSWSALLLALAISPVALIWSREKESTRTVRLWIMAGVIGVSTVNAVLRPELVAISLFVVVIALSAIARDIPTRRGQVGT